MARILVIDDDDSIRHLLREILEMNGHEVWDAADGRAGVSLYRRSPVDLIITDILMPEKDGVELIMELKEYFPEVRIVAMSGGGRGLDAAFNLRMAQDFGALRVLVKPFSSMDVVETVEWALNQKVV